MGNRFELVTRLGFAARAIIYFMIGFLALRTGRTEDGTGILRQLNGGLGTWLVALMAVGLFSYGAWRISEAVVDGEAHGSDAKGMVARAGGMLSGVLHLLLGYSALKLALGSGSSSSSEVASAALMFPGGTWLLTLAAVALLLAGAYQFLKAYNGEFLVHLDQRVANKPWVTWLGRAGYTARGFVFLVMAWFLWHAAREADPGQAADMGRALGSLEPQIQTIVAAGLLLFGVFSGVEAVYRRIHDPHVLREMRGKLRF